MIFSARLAFLTVIFSLFACSFTPKRGTTVNLKWGRPGPQTTADFKCFALNVVGEGIPSLDSEIASDWQSVINGKTCSYPGFSTSGKSLDSPTDKSVDFKLKVSPGKRRVFQVVGINTTGSCPSEDLGTLLSYAHRGILPTEIEGLYEVGRTTADVVTAGPVEVKNTYSVSGAFNLKDCFPKAETGLAISPGTVILAPYDFYQIKPSGGVPPFTYRVVDANTFITVGTTTGLVTANTGPPIEGTVEVTDFAGSKATANFRFSSPQVYPELVHWYRASQYLDTRADDATLVAADTLTNRGSLTLATPSPSVAPDTAKGVRFRRRASPNGFASVELHRGYGYFYFGTGASVSDDHAVYMVARRSASNSTNLFCISQAGVCTGSQISMALPAAGNDLTFAIQGPGEYKSKSVSPSAAKEWNLLRGSWGGGGTQVTVAINGEAAGVTTLNTSLTVANGYLSIGTMNGGNNADYLELAEVLVYDSNATVSSVEAYLRDKYSLY